ncbi:substrate-binding domain-containing protein [Streptomyces sp. NBC_00247]|uniref:substrate-binding domain-containing protein n=1 Tax=Streptomyces sp. NBC_00247 TaxID=2975689 RepID=UPI002E2D3D70|nr:substrate-binding domain-containing protein [Streptomyces sp. NBC_00247]
MPQRFDPRGRANRALLVGVPEYEEIQPRDLKAVNHNLAQLSEVLRTGKLFDPDEITVCRPEGVDDFTRALNDAVQSAEGLLLFYFAGHGAVPAAADELWLQMRNARVVAGSAAVFQGSQSWSQILGTLVSSRAEQIVVVLDCCHAGNAALVWEARREKQRVSQLMSVQANNLISAGPGTRPTPFTEQLLRILKGGLAGQGGDVGFHALSEELRTYMTTHFKTERPEPWEPQSRPATSGVDVLLATDIPPADEAPTPSGWRRRPAVTVAAAVVVVALLGCGAYLLPRLDTPVRCAPPLELRLLTDPGIETTVRKAATAYMASDANRTDDGCRRSGITTYSAGAADVVAAFRDDTAAWQQPATGDINPQRDVGPQPDIWIPAVSADVERAGSGTGPSSASMGDLQPLASSPIVLAVPKAFAQAPSQSGGRKLADLLTRLREKYPKARVRRADPEFTEAALLASSGLYATAASGREAEKSVAHPGSPAATASDLLCDLAEVDEEDDRTAVLVPEHLFTTGPGCDSWSRAVRVAQYSDDVPGLDLTYVRVTWKDAERDQDARNEAAEGFRKWLGGKAGTGVFRGDGFRAPTGGKGTGPTAGWTVKPAVGTLADPGPLAGPASGDTMNEALRTYRGANGPGSVLFLLDSSGSMGTKWHGPSGAPGILKQSLRGLGGKDEYGVWSVGEKAGKSHTTLLDFGSHRNADAESAIDERAEVGNVEADPSHALDDAWSFMATQDTGDQNPRLIVYLTDDEEKDKLTEGGRLARLLKSARERAVPIVVVSMQQGTCDSGKPNERIAVASGGRCLDANRSDLVPALQDEVARTGSGDQQ